MNRPRARYERARLRTRRQMHAAITVGVAQPAPDPEKVADTLTAALVRARDRAFTTVPPEDDDLPPGITSVAELMTTGEYAAMDEEFWGKWDAPTVSFTVAEEAAWAEIIAPHVKGDQS